MSSKKRRLWKTASTDEIDKYVLEINEEANSKCPVDRLRQFTEIAKNNSCGECVICREGIYQLYIIINEITNALGKNGDLDIIEEIVENLIEQSSCDYGKKVGQVIKKVISEEQPEFEKHIKRKLCNAGVCEKLKKPEPIVTNTDGLGVKRRRRRS